MELGHVCLLMCHCQGVCRMSWPLWSPNAMGCCGRWKWTTENFHSGILSATLNGCESANTLTNLVILHIIERRILSWFLHMKSELTQNSLVKKYLWFPSSSKVRVELGPPKLLTTTGKKLNFLTEGKVKMKQTIKFKHFSFLIHLTKMLLLFEQETI